MITAMKQALEALEEATSYTSCETWSPSMTEECVAAAKALRQASDQAGKPDPKCVAIIEVLGKDWRLDYMSLPVGKHRLYAQEYTYNETPTPTAPAQQPLTDDDLWNIWDSYYADTPSYDRPSYEPCLYRAIEAHIKGASL